VGASVNYSPEFTSPEPNHNLLRRLAESGGGKVLDPSPKSLNPFLHDRQKTFQPRDLWESLLKFAVILFTLDVGVRRIQIDREEWRKMMLALRRRLFFWQGVPRTPEAEESLGALLVRREQVRSRQTAPTQEPRPDLFQPARPVVLPQGDETVSAPTQEPETPAPVAPKSAPEPAGSTTSRLLEAKKRAQKRRD